MDSQAERVALMAFTQQDLDNLDLAIASGVRELQHSDGSRVQYRSFEEMIQARQRIAKALEPAASQSRTTYAVFGKS